LSNASIAGKPTGENVPQDQLTVEFPTWALNQSHLRGQILQRHPEYLNLDHHPMGWKVVEGRIDDGGNCGRESSIN
jgi:hypothetical protein